jgi:hypothetical protein
MTPIEAAVAEFKPISLPQMDSVALMNRVDTKYVISEAQVTTLLNSVIPSYQVLEVGAGRIFPYRTVYYDTEDLFLLHQHLHGKLNREKIRAREYVGTASRFFELKRKTNKGRTIKKRIAKTGDLRLIQEEETAFLKDRSGNITAELSPVIEVGFSRITLVSLQLCERVTIDLKLGFSGPKEERPLENIAIVEVKKGAEGGVSSPVTASLKHMMARPFSISKYCLGMVLLNETDFYNPYKSKLLKLNKIATC